MTEHDDTEHDELGRLVRASLDAHAGEVDTSVPVAARARSAARRHRGRWVAAGAAVVVAAVAVTAVVVDRADPPSSEAPPVATDLPTQWRTEYWHDISVQVPSDWGWGAGPFNKSMARCGGPHDPSTPYVGRPIALSDACGIQKPPTPKAAYLWFDAPVDPGTVDLPNGYKQDTVEVDADGTTVTVGSDDQVLRERILASVARQDLCPASVRSRGLDVDDVPTEEPGVLESFKLCAYSEVGRGSYDLAYSTDLGPAAYARWQHALPDDPGAAIYSCAFHRDKVVLTATFDDPDGDAVTRSWVADVGCNLLSSAGGDVVITPAMKDVFEDEGLRASLQSFGAWG